jgi:cyclophilin family peptidyl-prolyl cis-trans isomerase
MVPTRNPEGVSTMKKLLAVTAIVMLVMMAAGAVFAKDKDNPMVVLETTEGPITIELYPDKAPLSVDNFLWYVDHGFYDGLIFHRVIKNFMIQGGGFTGEMMKKAANPPIENESTNGLANEKYTIAMARTSAPNSATCQFFINTKDNVALDRANAQDGVGYCVFGKVTKGTDTVDAIEGTPTATQGGYNDVPKSPIVIKAAYRVDKAGKKIEKDKAAE